VRRLVEDEGREVIVLGDINVCAAPIDHCEGELPSKLNGGGLGGGLEKADCEGVGERREPFYSPPAREWFRNWLAKPEDIKSKGDNTGTGMMVDVIRMCWPERKGMYTCKLLFSDKLKYQKLMTSNWCRRLEHKNISTRKQLWYAHRLHPMYAWAPAVDQARGHLTLYPRVRSLSSLHRPP